MNDVILNRVKLVQYYQEKRSWLTKKAYIELALQVEFGEYFTEISQIDSMGISTIADKYSIMKDPENDIHRELIITPADIVGAIASLVNKNLIKDPEIQDNQRVEMNLGVDLFSRKEYEELTSLAEYP